MLGGVICRKACCLALAEACVCLHALVTSWQCVGKNAA